MICEVDPVPGWLVAGLAREPQRTVVEVDALRIACRVWEPADALRSRRTYLLLHGNAAQSEWWDAIAPLLAADARVVAVDLSGHGESDRREDYTLDAWASEAIAVVRDLAAGPTLIVGHSMGGLIAIKAAWMAPDLLTGVLTLDTPLRRYTPEQLAKRAGIAGRPLPRFDSRSEAMAAFKTVPPLMGAPRPLVTHVAERSYRQDGDQWTLKCDPIVYRRTTDVDEFLRPFPRETYCVRAQHGLISEAMAEEIIPQLASAERMIDVPGVGHNLILEAPLAVAWLVAGITARIGNES